jgi:hypothetical protein
LLAAVGDQVRRSAAWRQEQLAAAPLASALPPPAPQQQQQQQQQIHQNEAVQWEAAEDFSLAQVASLVDSHLRLGYRPPPLLLQCLAPQILRQLSSGSAEDAATLLQQLAAVPLNPGVAVVGRLLGRVEDSGGELAAAARQAAETAMRTGCM